MTDVKYDIFLLQSCVHVRVTLLFKVLKNRYTCENVRYTCECIAFKMLI